MHPELQAFVSKYGYGVIAAMTVVASVGLVQWGRMRRAELLSASLLSEAQLELLARIVDRPHGAPPRRGVIEQISQLGCAAQVLMVLLLGTSPVAAVLIVCVTFTSAFNHTTHRLMVERQMIAAWSQQAAWQAQARQAQARQAQTGPAQSGQRKGPSSDVRGGE
ncbi:MAG: hypothetical protein U0939_04995 [Pirellulales bacterium]